MIDMKKKLDEDEINEDMNTTEPEKASDDPAEDTPNEETPDSTEPVSDSKNEPTEDVTNIGNEDFGDDAEKGDNQDTFPRDYVEKLRDENAKYRQRAQRADDLALRLHAALTESTGRLQDAGDLPFEESHIDNPEALTAAIDELLKS